LFLFRLALLCRKNPHWRAIQQKTQMQVQKITNKKGSRSCLLILRKQAKW
tara:strand:+ start:109063 stop:109212 length:150 start_codon:yes stop_codon:yes gene_type:complete